MLLVRKGESIGELMSVKTANIYGTISISEDAIARVSGAAALECYGVCELTSRRFFDGLLDLVSQRPYGGGVRVDIVDNQIKIGISAILKYGVSIDAVAESIRNSVVYNVESFTGMPVRSIKVDIVGVKL
ncbi:MAG: Asp23/Gls24 family envelope stress response protein [Clostridia bacterium]|nr:Asp23/Gls24 family envelope stress response protein [Clostridia bacterium]